MMPWISKAMFRRRVLQLLEEAVKNLEEIVELHRLELIHKEILGQ